MSEEKDIQKDIGEEKKDDILLEGYERKFIIYKDDDDTVKNKVAQVKLDTHGVFIKIGDSDPFWIPYTQVLKIKPYVSKSDINREVSANNGRRS